MISTKDSYFSTDDEFTTEDGLMIAFTITAYDSEQESIEDPTYGNLKAYYKTWGIADQVQSEGFEEIPLKFCSKAQLGLLEESKTSE